MNRWTLGGKAVEVAWADELAADIMFTNQLFSRFFNNGQVIDTIRGGGIFQPAVDKAIELLEDGEWVSHARECGLMTDSRLSRGQD